MARVDVTLQPLFAVNWTGSVVPSRRVTQTSASDVNWGLLSGMTSKDEFRVGEPAKTT
jgi:hypothetical protein